MKKMVRRTFAAITAVVLGALTAIALSPSPALAATCYGASCLHQDPSSTGCSTNATNLASFRHADPFADPDPLIELRYSSTCNAAWARVTDGDCRPWACGGIIEASLNKNTIAHWSYNYAAPRPGAQVWTNMMPFNYWVRACIVNWIGDGFTYQRVACTAWK